METVLLLKNQNTTYAYNKFSRLLVTYNKRRLPD